MSEKVFEVHRKFAPLIKILQGDPAYKHIDTICVSGGRNSFKSYTISGILAVALAEFDWKILFTRYTMASAEDSVIAEVNEKIRLFGYDRIVKSIARRIIKTDSEVSDDEDDLDNSIIPQIVFKGIKTSSGNQTANLKSLKGFNCFVLDEAEEHPNYKDFRTIQRSIRRKDLQNLSILVFNPPTKQHWIFKELYEKKGLNDGANCIIDNVCYIHMTYLDMVRFVADNVLADYERAKQTDPDDYKYNILGGFREKAEGVIFKRWRYGEFNNELPYCYGSDYGFYPDPDVLVKVAIDKRNKKLYVKEEFTFNEMPPTDLVAKTKAIVGNKKVHAESAEKRINDMMKNAGINNIPTKKYPNSVIDGVKIMLDYEIIVDQSSINIGSELNNYVEKNGEPVDKDNHRIDAIRYVVMGETQVITRSGNKFDF